MLPLLLCFFLGRREGMIGAGVFLLGMTVLMMAPGLVGSHVYETGHSLRFLVAYLFLTLVGWSYARGPRLSNPSELKDSERSESS